MSTDVPRQGTSRSWALPVTRGVFAASGALPWVLPFARAYLPMGPLGVLLDGMFFFVCHRRAERTLVFAGVPMPLCSRCAGIALGLALGAILAWPRPSARAARIAAVLTGLLMVADVVTQDLGLHPVWHATRIASGAAFGFVLAVALFALIRREYEGREGQSVM